MGLSSVVSNLVVTSMRVIGSTVVGRHNAVLMGVEGTAGGIEDFEEDEGGESRTDVETFSAPGIIWRPRPKETIDGEELEAEAKGVRTPEGSIPLAWRDLRFNRVFPAPKPGTVALVGYGGGFLSFDDTDDGSSSLATWYVPYGDKAMAIAMDPDAESLMLVHGDGYAIVMDPDNGITLRDKSGSSWLNMNDGKFEVVANTIQLRGNVALGADTSSAIPLLPGIASQPTPSVFFSPV